MENASHTRLQRRRVYSHDRECVRLSNVGPSSNTGGVHVPVFADQARCAFAFSRFKITLPFLMQRRKEGNLRHGISRHAYFHEQNGLVVSPPTPGRRERAVP
ncbi:unnamed protein product, partial [Ectocarpus fasciculatus]